MAEQTFTSGQILTASQMTTLQTNIGLSYITGGALSSTGTNFVSCFSATYENYRIEFSKIDLSSAGFLSFQLLNGSTPFASALYHSAIMTTNSTATTVTVDKTASGTTAILGYNFQSTTDGASSFSYDFMNPFGTGRTFYTGGGISYYAVTPFMTTNSGGGGVNSTTSFDGIRILNASAGNIAGNVRIYGYRNS